MVLYLGITPSFPASDPTMTQTRNCNSLSAAVRRALPAALLLALVGLSGCGKQEPEAEADQAKADSEQTAQADAKDAEGEQDGDGKGKDGKKEAQPVPVEVVPVARRDIEASYAGTAALEAPEEAQVVAKTSGVLLQLLIEEGDAVKAGQVIARIDADRTRLEVERMGAMLRKLEAEYSRSKELFERKLVATDSHERLRYDVETQRAAWELAKLELSYTNVTAPIGGMVAQRMVKTGNLVTLNQPMFRIVGNERLEAVLNVPERELRTMRADLPVTLTVDALPGVRFEGSIDRVSPVVDAATGTFRATAEFTDISGRLKPGMFGRIAVVYDRRSDSLSVPRIALLEEEAEPAVFVVREDKVVRTPIALGYVNGAYAEVTQGLVEGDQVVTAGKVAVRDGSKVQIINPSSALAQAESTAIAETAR